ncbi:Carboxy-terminal domain (CTD) phosphatase [Entomortierella chlamydospora]|uniref:RNA polymerase II subunit A C-terminal domain phosphatase n=1 Tax=Entomortierella chlamydospora TaxID=101097 RepID=A0A9P6MUG4_9FUNG|nr:Carboxy-terminal domain (CTD) phosphatase [Entomortierella chlamydospora]
MSSEDKICHSIPAKFLPATIISIKTSEGKTQSEGDELIEYEYMENVEGFIDEGQTSSHARRSEIRANKDGIVKTILVAKGQVIDDARSHVNMTHDATSLTVSRGEAKRLELDNVERLLGEGKLSLIVDLDQTLIHATVGTAIDEWVNAQGKMPEDIKMFPLPDSPTPYYIKKRPHLDDFLQKLSSMYELHIYTMGTRNYAAAVANVIDPDGKLFNMTQKSIERLFPCDTSMVVVIDDRADVWRYSPNLVKVHPYEYFVGTGDINAGHLPKQEKSVRTEPASVPTASDPGTLATNPSNPPSDAANTSDTPNTSNKSTNSDSATTSDTTAAPDTPIAPPKEPITTPSKPDDANKISKPKAPVMDDNDDELIRVLKILEAIHEQFYDNRENFIQNRSTKKADVKAIIHSMKSEVLKGVNVVFSGVIPKHQNPEKTDIWRQADGFGAHCLHEVDSRVTHVVAAQLGTEKVMKARRRKNIKIVRPEWLYHSIAKWKKQDEAQYSFQDASGKSTSNSTTPPILTEGEEDIGIEDDDLGGISEGMDENHHPLSINNDEINEHLKSVNWDDMEKEVQELVGDMDESDFDSDTSTRSNTQSDASTDGNGSPFINLKRARIPRKSGLGATVTYGSSDDEDDNDSISNGLGMDGLQGTNDAANSDESDGEIDEESGSDGDDESQGGSEVASDAERPTRPLKRRRIDGGNGKQAARAGRDSVDEGIDADDEITMDHSTVYLDSQGDDDSDGGDDEEDDDDFLNFMENDIEAQLQEDNNDD